MVEIYDWIKRNNLWYCVGYIHTHMEYEARIWTHLYKLQKLRAISWSAAGKTPDEALKKCYEKAKEGLPNIPKTAAELDKKIYYGKS